MMDTRQGDSTICAAWQALIEHGQTMRGKHLADMFAADKDRFTRLHREAGPLLLDFSKQRIEQQTLKLLLQVAREKDLEGWIGRLFGGERVNSSEDRAAMHWALRLPADADCRLDGTDVTALVHAQLKRMGEIVDKVRAGQWRGATGEIITDVVNIGVGGSDLGPLMMTEALTDSRKKTASPLHVHFASTMDGSQLSQLLGNMSPHSTLFVISSKSFTTIDTLSNADTARHWLQRGLGNREGLLDCHFLAVSSAADKMTEWGIAQDNQMMLIGRAHV